MSYEVEKKELDVPTEELLRRIESNEIFIGDPENLKSSLHNIAVRMQVTRKIRSLVEEVGKLGGHLDHADQKARHGCTDAYCKECDGPMDNLNPQSEMFQIQRLMRAKESSD